jgi:hypothetical protein
MKALTRFATLSLLMSAIALVGLANTAVAQQPATARTEAEVGNMVLYTTKRGNYKITAVTPAKLKGVSDPIISLTNKKVCPKQPISVANLCVVRLDPITPSTLSDDYFVVYYADDANNPSVGAANAQFLITSLTGWFLTVHQSRLAVGDSIPGGHNGSHPHFLLFVMSNYGKRNFATLSRASAPQYPQEGNP